MKVIWCQGLFCVLAALCFADRVVAQPEPSGGFSRPLAIGNQSPVIGIYGIPKAQGTILIEKGKTDWDATVELTSHYNETILDDESISLDGETVHTTLHIRYGLSDDWNIGLEIPWVRHSEGFLDGFIVEWHDFWGFPQNGRDVVPEDRMLFRYKRKDRTRLNLESPAEGIGDVLVSTQGLLVKRPGTRAVLTTQVKLPTGDPDKLTGSGALDIGAGIELSRRWQDRWHSNFHAGLAYLSDGDVLPDLRQNLVAYGGVDVVWRPLRVLSLRVQYDAHSAPYRNSELDELTSWSGMLTTGGTIYITRNTTLDLAVVENVPNASPVSDVSFYIRLRGTLGGQP